MIGYHKPLIWNDQHFIDPGNCGRTFLSTYHRPFIINGSMVPKQAFISHRELNKHKNKTQNLTYGVCSFL